jgi:hypothetical protein
MKKIILLLLVTFSLLCLGGCSKDNTFPPASTPDQLPPATMVGANTVGCLVNGEVFLPHKNNPFGSSSITCFYQFVNGAYHFSLGFSNDLQTNVRGVNIASHNIVLQQGNTYQLINNNGNSSFGSYYNFADSQYFTTNIITGELKITKLDQVNSIISGAFWFDGINSTGIKTEVRDGRFDLQYTP